MFQDGSRNVVNCKDLNNPRQLVMVRAKTGQYVGRDLKALQEWCESKGSQES